MRFKISYPLFVLGFFLATLPLKCMEEKRIASTNEYDQMGIEIETSALKIIFHKDSPKHSGLKVTCNDQEWWSVEEDTSDYKLGSKAYNLELRTHGGFNKERFLEVFKIIHSVLHKIYTEESISHENILEYKLGGRELRKIIGKVYDKNDFNVNKYGSDLYLVRSDKVPLRPQITYKLPLDWIPKVFERLRDIKNVKRFLDAISVPEITLTKPRASTSDIGLSLDYTNKMKNYNILSFFKKLDIPQRMRELEFTENLKGFTCLFLDYWANLFNNNLLGNDDLQDKQPGLKPFLYVMSRIPFSELYDFALTPNEQNQFKLFIVPILEMNSEIELPHIHRASEEGDVGNACKLRRYIISKDGERKFNDNAGMPTLTLREWYESTVDIEKRVDGKDKLSPSPGLALTHGMGAYEWQKVKAPLIEVRGYATLFRERVKEINAEVAFPSLYNFIIEECEWFFDLRTNQNKEKEK